MNHALSIGRKWRQGPQATCLVFGVIGWCSVTLGCVPSKVHVQSAPQFNPSAISSIAILPFQPLQTPQLGYSQTRGEVKDPEEIRTQFRLPGADQAPWSNSPRNLYSVSDTAAQFITARVESALASRSTLRVIGPREVAAIVPLEEERFRASLKVLAEEVGDRLKVDGVLMGLVRTYRERDGSRIGAKPAAVGFEVFLVQPADGVVLWKGEFYEEQKPLTQDVVGIVERLMPKIANLVMPPFPQQLDPRQWIDRLEQWTQFGYPHQLVWE